LTHPLESQTGHTLLARMAQVVQSITTLETKHPRPIGSSGVNLLAVSKTRDVAEIRTLLAEGQRDFGENYLQEAVNKIEILKNETIEPAPVWHYIGGIQSNKTRPIAEHFDWVHTLASEKVATRLAQQRPASLAPLNVLIQINIDNEDSKNGIKPAALDALAEVVLSLPRLKLRGLMVIPRAQDNIAAQALPFQRLRELLLTTQQRYGAQLAEFDQLSMGMSGDIEAAIQEGATWVRIGTAIFGPRSISKS
jgi:pyridoxal phosphate enzyme (YggS family)